MPHPEDLVDKLMGGEDGLPMFTSLMESLAAA
jgi:phosphoribosylformylglycinamidine synthase